MLLEPTSLVTHSAPLALWPLFPGQHIVPSQPSAASNGWQPITRLVPVSMTLAAGRHRVIAVGSNLALTLAG